MREGLGQEQTDTCVSVFGDPPDRRKTNYTNEICRKYAFKQKLLLTLTMGSVKHHGAQLLREKAFY